MVWTPYTDAVLVSLPPYCLRDGDIWRSVCPLIHFHIVEHHYPDRVLRQFGMMQDIPEPRPIYQELHDTDRRGRGVQDWGQTHRVYVQQWGSRHTSVVAGGLLQGRLEAGDPYMTWYQSITRRLIQPVRPPPPVGAQPVGSIREILVYLFNTCVNYVVFVNYILTTSLLLSLCRRTPSLRCSASCLLH